jgi:starch phosphorylase
MKNIHLFTICPAIPEKLCFLETLSRNLWWCWDETANDLFRRIDSHEWKNVNYNPIRLLSNVPQKRLETLAADEAFLAHLNAVKQRFEVACVSKRVVPSKQSIAYFSLEFGIHETVRIYSGGLGALAGDHLKSASDLAVPLAAVGLMYRQGYFRQFLNQDGMQQESYPDNEVHHMPMEKVLNERGEELLISVNMPEGPLYAKIWRVNVGCIPLYLLDANTPENPHEFRVITARLYGGDQRNRLRQELLLGIGGFRALRAMGIEPAVCHINEGHAAFLCLARIEFLTREKGLTFEQALEVVPRCSVFTTHTPVPAGNEYFPLDLLRPHLLAALEGTGLDVDAVIALTQPPGHTTTHEASMTVLGLRMARYANGVSRLHGEVARSMWAHLWHDRAVDEIPIDHITNGVHVPTWLSAQNIELFDRYIGPGWRQEPGSKSTLDAIAQIPDEELWRAHEVGRSRLIRAARAHAEKQYLARHATRTEIAAAKSILDHDTLTIGFARRFATYKRGTLLLHTLERFEAMLTNADRPVQFLFAGKAHPADMHGKDLIRQIVHFARNPKVRSHIVFLENYNMGLARRLVQGVDVWLNTPRRPMEASGTSGMKAALNGVLNASTLDGWWCEGYAPDCGWAIGNGEVFEDPGHQDSVEAQALYNLLENEIIPTFYNRPDGDLPSQWLAMMKSSMRMALGRFSSHRMVSEYRTRYYDKAAAAYKDLLRHDAKKTGMLVKQHKRLSDMWSGVRIRPPQYDCDLGNLHVGDTFTISTEVFLGGLKPEEVDIEVFYGPVNSENHILEGKVEVAASGHHIADGHYRYQHKLTCERTGRYAFTTRVTPKGDEWDHAMPGFTTWADS